MNSIFTPSKERLEFHRAVFWSRHSCPSSPRRRRWRCLHSSRFVTPLFPPCFFYLCPRPWPSLCTTLALVGSWHQLSMSMFTCPEEGRPKHRIGMETLLNPVSSFTFPDLPTAPGQPSWPLSQPFVNTLERWPASCTHLEMCPCSLSTASVAETLVSKGMVSAPPSVLVSMSGILTTLVCPFCWLLFSLTLWAPVFL